MNEAHLLKALKNKLNHTPRTRYWSAAGQPKYTNELILADSPYLLQHAHNPINWRIWNEELFKEAQQLLALVSQNLQVFSLFSIDSIDWSIFPLNFF